MLRLPNFLYVCSLLLLQFLVACGKEQSATQSQNGNRGFLFSTIVVVASPVPNPSVAAQTSAISRIKEIQQAIANGASKEQFDAELTEIRNRYIQSKEIKDLLESLLR